MHYPSIVVEWDNPRFSGNRRAFECLAIVLAQLREARSRLTGTPELVVTFDPTQASETLIRNELARICGEDGWPGLLKLLAVPPGTNYYQQKNLGFAATGNDIVIFLDSDLLPEKGWLEAMLSPFADYRHSVVVGNTYMDTSHFYARAVSLFWIFETRANDSAPRPTDRLVSNNIAFRRGVFQRLPFPDRTTYRGQCSELGRLLARHGIGMLLNPVAQANHPPPEGIRHFISRALHAGNDECRYRRFTRPVRVSEAFAQFRVDLGVVHRRVQARAPVIGAGLFTRACGLLLGTAFYALKCIAFAITAISERAGRILFLPLPG